MSLNEDTYLAIQNFVRKEVEWACSAHDMFHIGRVVKLAQKMYTMEGEWDLWIIIAGAWLHESFDHKFMNWESHEERKWRLADFLSSLVLVPEQIEHILFIAENVWFTKSLSRPVDFMASKEFQIIEDADRLDALWAIAIARCFAYGWRKWRDIHDPNKSPLSEVNHATYPPQHGTSTNHFYDKLFRLKDLMHTSAWRRLAEERHTFTEHYLEQFLREWNLED